MPKTKVAPSAQARAFGSAGIFGANWSKWRGAIVRISLADEPPFVARLESVHRMPPEGQRATLTELDEALRPVKQRQLPWPPDGEVCVLRTP